VASGALKPSIGVTSARSGIIAKVRHWSKRRSWKNHTRAALGAVPAFLGAREAQTLARCPEE